MDAVTEEVATGKDGMAVGKPVAEEDAEACPLREERQNSTATEENWVWILLFFKSTRSSTASDQIWETGYLVPGSSPSWNS